MFQTYAHNIGSILTELQDLAWGFGMEPGVAAEEWEARLGRVILLCDGLEWEDLSRQARRLIDRARNRENGQTMMALTEDLKHAFRAKLDGVVVLVIEDRDKKIYEDSALAMRCSSLHDSLFVSEGELNLAGKALATGLSTASVFHSMRSVEASLQTLCRVLKINFTGGVGVQDWRVLTERIKAKIEEIQKSPKSESKASALAGMSKLLVPANAFRLAWRNHAMHAREKYESEEARAILRHVADYLEQLSISIRLHAEQA